MATFAKSTFNAARYASSRPTYPQQLFDFAFQYHAKSPNPRFDLAVDLGCGTGQVTTQLSPFKAIYGVDPSPAMIAQAKQSLASDPSPNSISFVQGAAEDLSFIPDSSVDLVVAGQAAHWFSYTPLYTTLARILRPGGCFAFWGYSEFRIRNLPFLTPLINAYTQGSDPETSLGPYWQQPGRKIVDNHFFDIPPPPTEDWSDWTHTLFIGDHYPDLSSPSLDIRPTILHKPFTWTQLESYLRTFSSLHTYHEKYPTDASLKQEIVNEDYKETEGDIAQRFLGRLREAIRKQGTEKVQDILDIEWPMALIMARRT